MESTGRAARSGPVSGATGRQEPRPPIRLYICVSPDRTPQPGGTRRRTPRYHVSARLNFPDSATLHPEQEPEARAPVTRRQLNARVAELLTRVAELCHHRSDPVALDFFLPLELLDEPVEWWNRDPTLDYGNPLFHAYEVTVHSLERMQRSRFHNAWRRRWARWQENRTNGRSVPHPNGEVHVCLPDPSLTGAKHLSRLGATVGGNNDVVGLLLCEPPWRRGTLGEREVGLALDLGLAVLMYHRPGGAAAPWRDALAEAGLAGLPRLANQWRFAADMEKTGAYDPAVIRAMAMVYDDPEQLLDGGPTAPVTFVGGTE
nr:hypothetical protein [Streptomyces sp. SID13726]